MKSTSFYVQPVKIESLIFILCENIKIIFDDTEIIAFSFETLHLLGGIDWNVIKVFNKLFTFEQKGEIHIQIKNWWMKEELQSKAFSFN